MKSKDNRGITEGVIWKQLLTFFFPLLFGTFFQQFYTTLDAVIVGQYVGKQALSAVGGSTTVMINLMVGLFVGISSGATVTIAQFYGRKDDEGVSKAVHTAIAMAIAGGAIFMVIGITCAPAALRWMNTPEDIIPYALLFMRIYFCGMIANLLYNMGAGILRAIGDSRRPLYFLIASCGLNILLDFLFVITFQWGVAGVGVATLISQIFSAALVCMTLMKTDDSYKLSIKKIRFHPEMLSKIVRIGVPTGFQSLMYSISNLMIQSNINGFGTDTVAAWTAYGKIDSLFWMIMGAFGISITTFVGQNFGAGKIDRVKKGVRVCLSMAITVTVCLSALLYFFGEPLLMLFTKDRLVLDIGLQMLRYLVPLYFAYVCAEILSGSLRGMGNSLKPMILTLIGICGFRMLWVLIAVPLWPSLNAVLFSYPIAWVSTSTLLILYYRYFTKRELHKITW